MTDNLRSGFTLIEISIVLVIIGLILGGILVGRDLIKAAQARRIVSQYSDFETAINAFKLKYNCLPGDCTNATMFFTGAINGNGDGQLGFYDTEGYQLWYQLAQAGLIAGAYSGSGIQYEPVVGTNVPAVAGWSQSGWLVTYQNVYTISGNFFIIGSDAEGGGWSRGLDAISARNVDIKIDDGFPRNGILTADDEAGTHPCLTGCDGCALGGGGPAPPEAVDTYILDPANEGVLNCEVYINIKM